MALRNFINGIALVVLFSIALLFFMQQMITTNNPTGAIANDPFLNATTTSLQSHANDLTTVANNAKTRLESEQPSTVFLFLIVYSAFAIPLAFIAFSIGSVGAITTFLFILLFGAGASQFSLVAGVISAILLITIVFYMLRAIRTGDTEH